MAAAARWRPVSSDPDRLARAAAGHHGRDDRGRHARSGTAAGGLPARLALCDGRAAHGGQGGDRNAYIPDRRVGPTGARPCIILLDLMMPVMDGWTFRHEMLKDPSLASIPVIVMTAATPARAAAI